MTSERIKRLMQTSQDLPGSTSDIKWEEHLVFSVATKMFVIFTMPDGFPFSLKVEPGWAEILTQMEGVIPAPYLARHGWLQVQDSKALSEEQMHDLIRDSYRLVTAKLSKRRQRELGLLED